MECPGGHLITGKTYEMPDWELNREDILISDDLIFYASQGQLVT
jgi:hypothetical protein